MAHWTPNETAVNANELVGRRIFEKADRTILSTADIKSDVFDDSRLHEDLSVDRLGNPNPDRKALKYLTSLADEEAEKRDRAFNGWIAIHAKKLKRVTIKPDPLTLAKDGTSNSFHAVIDRSAVREANLAYYFSTSLYFQFRENGLVVPPRREAVTP